jgi:hypothetical protein
MRYSDFINVDEKFQYSINLELDLNKLNKLNSYVPTNFSIEILKKFINSVYYDSNERATFLVGPYGKGKSHLMLVLTAILSLKKGQLDESNNLLSDKVLTDLIDRIRLIDTDTGHMIDAIGQEEKRFLPVIINSNHLDLNQSFLLAIKEALERENLTHLIPDTYFDTALEVLNSWQTNYKETIEKFSEALSEVSVTLEELINKLSSYDNTGYELFQRTYPLVTSGSEFNPLINSDIVKLYNNINTKVCEELSYKGMIVVFDEFSKFLEGSHIRNSMRDLKIVQDMAELANRSGNNQLHFICITHKSIGDYLSYLPKQKIDGFRAVEGRFKYVYFTSSSQQNYELIKNAITKNELKFKEFLNSNDNYNRLQQFTDTIHSTGIFNNVDNYEDIIGLGCFPLNPISAFSVLRVSEKVAQNERTLFTFLAKDELGSFRRFISINDNDLQFLTLDWIYDYFEELFRKEVFNPAIHSYWLKANAALQKTNDDNESKIIKALAIIYIVNELDNLPPTDLMLKLSLCLDGEDFEVAVNSLIRKHLILKRKSNKFYTFLSGANLDITKSIQDTKGLKVRRVNKREVLESIIDLGYILPKKYNDEYEMIRFYKNVFVEYDEFININDNNEFINSYRADGIVLHLIHDEKDDVELAVKKFYEMNSDRIVLCTTTKYFSKIEELKELIAIRHIKQDNSFIDNDSSVIIELELFEEDIIEDIKSHIENIYSPKHGNAIYYTRAGKRENISKHSQLSKLVSELCLNCYVNAPVINNEMINKNSISTQITKARNKVIEYILGEQYNNDQDVLQGLGPEVTIYRATVRNKQLIDKKSNDIGLNLMLENIEKFLIESEGKKRAFTLLYGKLKAEPFGIRDGIIPIYLSYVLRNYKDNVVVYFINKEVPLNSDTLTRINAQPDKYFVLIDKGTNEKIAYLEALERAFGCTTNLKKGGYDRLAQLVDAMKTWFKSKPKYSRQYITIFKENSDVEIKSSIIQFRNELLKYDTNPRELLFDRLPNSIIQIADLDRCAERIVEIKLEIDSHMNEFIKVLIGKTKNLFIKSYQGELTQALDTWKRKLNKKILKNMFDSNTHSLINYIENMKNFDEEHVLKDIAYMITGLNLFDWNDYIYTEYLSEVQRIKSLLENYKEINIETDKKDNVLNIIVDGSNIERNLKFVKTSPLGELFSNNMEEIVDEYGDSIDINEKVTILMRMIKKMLDVN